ncbi:MAG: T9SS type A sorting domain-containing protein [Ignavibacteriaceae bacterium]|nr:T9SS type A sorting domain-containing protein [Ignavibacteriaceae bacterium]
MKKLFTLLVLLAINAFSQSEISDTRLVNLLYQAEENPSVIRDARSLALELGYPLEIYTTSGQFITLAGIENNQPLYLALNNFSDPYSGGVTLQYAQIVQGYDLMGARINYGNGRITNRTLGYQTGSNQTTNLSGVAFLVNSGADQISLVSAVNGDIIESNFITDASLSTPKKAIMHPISNNLTVCDQLLDVVLHYDTLTGNALGTFAPAGGVDTSKMDNTRGHYFDAAGNLYVTCGAGSSINSVVKYDASGNYLGKFIQNAAGGMNSPFDIIFRANDVLTTNYGDGKILSFDFNGNSLSTLTSAMVRPQQINIGQGSNLIVADFGVGGGLRVTDSTGNQLLLLNIVTANRGAMQLSNGNYLTANGGGYYELNAQNQIVRTLIAGSSCQYVTPAGSLPPIPVELVSFAAAASGNAVELNWLTVTETNNMGFEIEKSTDGKNFSKIGFVNGNGTTTGYSFYKFSDLNPAAGVNYYRLKQIDFDGSFEYSNVTEADFEVISDFALANNYPNPFNPSTKISFTVPEQAKVKLEVFNAAGELVSVLADQEFAKGNYSITFDASNLSSGMYIYKMTAVSGNGKNFTGSGKMLLQK